MVDRYSWPRVTEILRAIGVSPDYGDVDPSVLELARQRGSAVDLACDLLDQGDLDPSSVDPRIQPYVDAYHAFLLESRYKPEASQQPISHAGYRYRGTADMRGLVNGGSRLMADRKCTATMHPSYALQVAAYRLGHEHEHPKLRVDLIAGLHLRRAGSYRLILYDMDEATNVWLACVVLHNDPDSFDALAARQVVEDWKRRHLIS